MSDVGGTVRANQRDKLVVTRFRLVVTAGPDKGKELTSSGAAIVIGTQPPADLVLTDPKVSRLHCEIEIRNKRAVIRDDGSTNGTAIDGVVIHEAELASGQTIAI